MDYTPLRQRFFFPFLIILVLLAVFQFGFIAKEKKQLKFEKIKIARISKSGKKVFRSAREFEEFTGQKLEINFDQWMIVAIFMGEKPTGGYEAVIENITSNEKIEVRGKRISPGPNCILTQIITYPRIAVKIKKSEKPVKFRIKDEIEKCPY